MTKKLLKETIIKEIRKVLKESISYPLEDKGKWYGDEDYAEREGKLIYKRPKFFIDNTTPLKMDEYARENIYDLKKHIQNGGKLDPLVIYNFDKSNVKNSDGRHRAYASMELGIKLVPIILFNNGNKKYLKEVVDKISITNFNNSNFIDGKIFNINGGKLIIGKYSDKRPYSIIELIVDENFRRQGVATNLIKYALNYFKEGFTAQVSNLGSLDLHYKLGFRSFDNDLNIEDYKKSVERLNKNSSVNMASSTLLQNLDKYYK